MSEQLPLSQLVEQLAEALRIYDQLAFDEEYDHRLGGPCSPKQLAVLEKRLGKPLPPSYKAFLELHNGWADLSGDAKLLAVEDHTAEWVEEHLADLEEVFADLDQENPFEHGALAVLLGEDSNQVLYIDPHTARADGEMDFVALDITTEERRFPDFTSFLVHKLDLLRVMIDAQKKGIPKSDAE
ncbi:MAG: SMI1/KNR4 family protein [Mesorhizobium sp.]|uniref:SMI1/KNR4 family protein n=1 Tax=Mesorhizobium sp. TaxID=1871066 RepID=UPI000FE9CB27|nr:SMI1/KNR4 family protein [Mesorhizobium sp.]RWC35240.1 MAG: SMI1/KNR4 family protein [Mesorhizobium sp.]RWD38634.1 MAG: SMI1/KNR4 family protein [Mesorhizobium sp.]RWD83618.1 MAG: SMI1/KNR4 family protein [Mesorhizobium sp.]RWE65898.1 MAG: SMI1/KNR4 family protein [Mesorhizobium sp.]TIS79936.1 MAG: SMI1/KNR4 family protein [Mesorhizobium sp.]